MRMSFKELKDEIAKIVPKDLEYEVELEAGDIALVTKDPASFADSGLVGQIAKRVKRTIVLRPDPSIMRGQEEARRLIDEVLPESAGLKQVYFDACLQIGRAHV